MIHRSFHLAGSFVAIAFLIGLSGCAKRATDRYQGYIEGEYTYVSSPLPGAVQKLPVQRGAHVEEGAELFVLESGLEVAALRETHLRIDQANAILDDTRKGRRVEEIDAIEAQRKQAGASLSLADTEFRRQSQLFKSGAGTQRDLDAARFDREQAAQRVSQMNAELASARLGARPDQIAAAESNASALIATMRKAEWDLRQKTQTAPQAGVVFDTFYREGEWVPAGRPIVALLPPENVKLRVFFPEAQLSRIQVGNTIKVWLDGIEQPVRARITFISPQPEYTPPVIYSQSARQKLVFLVEAHFASVSAEKLHPGQPAEVELEQ